MTSAAMHAGQELLLNAIGDAAPGATVYVPVGVEITAAIEQRAFSKNVKLSSGMQEALITAGLPAHAQFLPESMKPSNPKDSIGSGKLPLELVPDVIPIYAAMAFYEGATKYGRFNWRAAGVRSSIYVAAARRHLAKYWNGEDTDPDTGVPHLASVLACVGIILDADASGKLTDDRPPKQDLGAVIAQLEKLVPKLKALHADKNPHQYTIEDEIK